MSQNGQNLPQCSFRVKINNTYLKLPPPKYYPHLDPYSKKHRIKNKPRKLSCGLPPPGLTALKESEAEIFFGSAKLGSVGFSAQKKKRRFVALSLGAEPTSSPGDKSLEARNQTLTPTVTKKMVVAHAVECLFFLIHPGTLLEE